MTPDMLPNQLEGEKRTLSVIMPAFNEEATIADIISRVLNLDGLLELIVVNDCSSDRTGEIVDRLAAENPLIRYQKLPANMGKTAALKAGIASSQGEIVIIQDADLEYDPSEIPEVIAPIRENRADVVYGSRFMVKRATRVLYFWHYVSNKGLTFVSNCFTNLNMSDIETCYKAFRGEIIRNMVISSTGFGFEVEVTAKVAKLGCAVYEVPISYYGRTYEEGKKIGFKDGLAAGWYIVKYNAFVPLSRSFRSQPKLLTSPRNHSALSQNE